MSLSDPVADVLTRIRNAIRIKSGKVDIKASNICENIAAVLKKEGYIADYDRIADGKQGILKISLKYDKFEKPAITEITRISKPSRRVYSSVEELPHIMAGMGIVVVSTSKGVMSDKSCREQKVGGEIICTVS